MIAREIGIILLSATVAAAGELPRENPDDQIRGFGLPDPLCYDALVAAGFNMINVEYAVSGCYFDLANNPAKDRALLACRQAWLDRTSRDGTDYVERFVLQQANVPESPLFSGDYAIRSPDGRVENAKALDRSNPDLRARLSAAVTLQVAHFPDPAPASFVGVQCASELRGSVRPSFTPAFRMRWRRASGGKEIPNGCSGRYGPNWQTLPVFPASRVVPDDHPILNFYRWFYRDGDGWDAYLNEVAAAAESKLGHPIMKWYAPAVRQPPLRGYASKMTAWSQWHYPYPEPYNVSYVVSELQAMSRTNPERLITMGVQGISYRKTLAPKEISVANPPAWVAAHPDVSYMTTPPDMACEAFWTLFTRRLSGFLLFACHSLFELPSERCPPGYRFTNAETFPAISNLLVRVAIPLGPLFKAIPERPMEVAVLESFSSAILAQRCDLAYAGPTLDLGTMLTAANLMPQVVYEEDLATGGVPESVRVLFLSQCEVLTESAARAIRAFRDRGGIVVGDEVIAPGIASDLTVSLFKRTGSAADEQRRMRDGAAKILAALALYYQPPTAASTPDIRTYVRTYRDSDFLFAVNDRRTAGAYVGAWGRIYEKGLPVEGVVSLRKEAGIVYDLLAHTTVPFSVVNGETRIPVALDAADGRVFLVAMKPLSPLKAETDGATVRVTSPDVQAMIPIELSAPGQKPRYGVVKGGLYTGAYPGKNVRIVNLANGVSAAPSPPTKCWRENGK